MSRYSSLSEMLQAYKTKGPGDSINAAYEGVMAGKKMADDAETRKQTFQTKLRELGILEDKNVIEREQLGSLERDRAASRIPAENTGNPFLTPLGPREVNISAANATTKANEPPQFRSQHVGFTGDGRSISYIPGTNGEPGRSVLDDGTAYSPAIQGQAQPKVAPNVPAGSVEENVSLDTLANQVQAVKQFKTSDDTGFIDAGQKKLASWVDAPSVGLGNDPQSSKFKQSISDVKDTLLRARSGAAINEAEYKRLMNLVPNEWRSDSDFNARMELFETTLNQIRESRKRGFSEAGYRTDNLSNQTQTTITNPVAAPGQRRTRKLPSGVEVIEED